MSDEKPSLFVRVKTWIVEFLLVLYLLVVGVGGAGTVLAYFPRQGANGTFASDERGLLILALAAGVAGSFLHAAQSLATYLGNKDFKRCWAVWYVLRPWIGGVLGLAIYAVFRAGLIGGRGVPDPYGVLALGLLGGWFSKTTTDKLQEVFETLFKTDEDKNRKDKLRVGKRPVINAIEPSPVPADAAEVAILGCDFQPESLVVIDGNELAPKAVSKTTLKVSLQDLPQRPAGGAEVLVQVLNPQAREPLSPGVKLKFEQ